MDEWHVGDPADWGDNVGVPDIPYMGYLQEDEEDDAPQYMSKCELLRRDAWRLRNEGNFREALNRINEALGYSNLWRNYNLKAIILEDMGDFDGALENYDIALSKTNSQLVRDNKARLLGRLAKYAKYSDNLQRALDCINEALRLTKDENDRCEFLATKRDVLSLLGRYRQAYVANKLANRQYDLVDDFEKQSEILKKTKDTLICITGRNHYGYSAPTEEGSIVDLIGEPENEHDPDAIRVEYNQKTVGYVANSHYTMIDEASSASQIKNMFKDRTKARIMFVFMEEHLVAKLI